MMKNKDSDGFLTNERVLMFVLSIVSVIGLLYFTLVASYVDPELLYDISTFGNIMSVLILEVMVINTIFLSKITDKLSGIEAEMGRKKK